MLRLLVADMVDTAPEDEAALGWKLETSSLEVRGVEYLDSRTLRVTAPDMRHVFAEGPLLVEVSLHEALPGKQRL